MAESQQWLKLARVVADEGASPQVTPNPLSVLARLAPPPRSPLVPLLLVAGPLGKPSRKKRKGPMRVNEIEPGLSI